MASVLSDLKSLSVCPHDAAMKLLSVRSDQNHESSQNHDASMNTTVDGDGGDDQALRRALRLVRLHQDVKIKQVQQGLDRDLFKARDDIQRVLASLNQV